MAWSVPQGGEHVAAPDAHFAQPLHHLVC